MATVQAPLTPASNTAPAVVSVPSGVPSGASWCAQYPGSASVADCVAPFKANLTAFLAALNAAGATVRLSATLRPANRAYLMHWSYMIAHDGHDPRTVPARDGVNIAWVHTDAQGAYDATASTTGAQAMVSGYSMGSLNTPPALESKHISGLAVDMTITWTGNLTINNQSGTAVVISTAPKTGMNADLATVGATFGVIKFVGGATDAPHWSDDGH